MDANTQQGIQPFQDAYTLVDTTVGSRVLLAFHVSSEAVQTRLPHTWAIEPYTGGYATTIPGAMVPDASLPNLFVVFNDFLLNRDAQGHPQADPQARYVGFNIPARNTKTGASGMIHFRIFTGTPQSVPGRFKDSLPATVTREHQLRGTGTNTTVFEGFTIISATGGQVQLEMEYQRGPLLRLVADQPNFPVWAAADPKIQRIYQEDALMDTILNPLLDINHLHNLTFRISIPELQDLFNGSEQLLAILANPIYSRRVFHPAQR
jgi:hypothetical protein